MAAWNLSTNLPAEIACTQAVRSGDLQIGGREQEVYDESSQTERPTERQIVISEQINDLDSLPFPLWSPLVPPRRRVRVPFSGRP